MPAITVPGWKCARCEHEWVQRGPERPLTCPSCRSVLWDRPRKAAAQPAA